ncbi:MAG TPA: M4 family metallopeptidase, partial [Vicinamibacteria bacterium]|nr:M4 family metallopeptidase [Vicinamibacteria bacterium]
MCGARWRRVAVAVVVALLVPTFAGAALRRVRRVLPAGARASSAPPPTQAANAQLDAAVARLRASLGGGTGPGVAAVATESDGVYVARTSQGYVRALQAPAGHAFFLTRDTTSTPEDKAVAFLKEHQSAFGMSKGTTSLKAGAVHARPERTFVRLQQLLGSLPVFGAAAVVQIEASGGVSFVLAHLARDDAHLNDPAFPTTPSVASAQAAARAVALVQAGKSPKGLATTGPELLVFEPSVIGSAGPSRLVWHVRVQSAAARVDEIVLVDAVTGEVAFHYSNVKDAKNRQIYNSAETSSPGTLVRSEGGPATGDADTDLAYTYMGDTYDFYSTSFGRDSYDNLGGVLLGRVHWCEPLSTGAPCPYNNAYWNGTEMRFGDGYASAEDVVAHELTHGVTEKTSDLIYWGEPGAIDESMSDIFGKFVQLTHSGSGLTGAERWLIGENLPGGAIRSMYDPTLY